MQSFIRFDFNPRPPWGGRPNSVIATITTTTISIHALRGEGDFKVMPFPFVPLISIHALRGEGDVTRSRKTNKIKKISIHALRGEGDYVRLSGCGIACISIHALRGEGDKRARP